ncbi:MAG: hypothetical protein ACI8TQ_003028 [Planctomycetota bacterium]|jgi:hypothetical protein
MDISSMNTVLGAVTITGVPLADRIRTDRGSAAIEPSVPKRELKRERDSAVFSERGLAALASEADQSQAETSSLAERIAAAAKNLASGHSDSTETDGAARHAELGETELTESEREQLAELRARDREVRAHEQAHSAAAGSLATGGPSYETQEGPDGVSYAVGGEVQISLASGSTPEESLRLADQARRAALAPARPSSQDQSVAAQATQMAAAARNDIRVVRDEAREELRSEEIQVSAEIERAQSTGEPGAFAANATSSLVENAFNVSGPIADRVAAGENERTAPPVIASEQTESQTASREQIQRAEAYGQVARAVNIPNVLSGLLG